MSFADKPMAKKVASNPLPPRTSRLLREAVSLVLSGIALYLALILISFDRTDPGWSHSGTLRQVSNAGGSAGAWLADLMLYFFGISAWWWVVFFFATVWWGYRRIDIASVFDPRVLMLSFTGFITLLVASSGIEALRFHTLRISLPLAPGGLLGEILSKQLSSLLGFTGATLAMVIIFAIGFSLFSGLSWVRLSEKIGGGIEEICFAVRDICMGWLNRRNSTLPSSEREVRIEEIGKQPFPLVPLHIEMPETTPPRSTRSNREKQTPQFSNSPDGIIPPLHLLDEPQNNVEMLSSDTLEFTSRLIERKLQEFGVEVKVVAAYPGPVITRYEIEPAVGVKGNQIVNLVRDLARALTVASIRVVETIPGKTVMGLEIPNPNRQTVRLHEILASGVYANHPSPLTIALGKDISGRPVVSDLAKMPHALVAGTTGSGKSVAINAIILSLVYKASPDNVRLILIDPKMLELSVYDGIPHLLTPVVTDMRDAASALNWCVAEMERRYKLMSALGVRNLAGYNQKVREAVKNEEPLTNPLNPVPGSPELLEEMPLIVVVIDELADLMMIVGKKVEKLIARLAQKARAAGIHLLLATQRPSVDVITGLIKANIPTRIAFQVSSKIDSRTILDQMGAEALLGQGDMLYLPPGSGYPQRVHGAFVADHEVHKVVEYLKQHGEAHYIEEILQAGEEGALSDENGGESGKPAGGESDPLYDEAVSIVIKSRRASISLVQRQLRIGYNRAARLIEEMERAGLVSSMQSNGNREVLTPDRNE
ncbi:MULTISPECIES: DNA translocase FtsK [Nitrosomonas]|uniref:FtsK/SpoIIIE family:AAA ATPase superfamily n=1 Tax=Nitrosomonas europaea (strain ATCC 19718 / CIP 103999 / KCTC 2705 / NBRC 14298) TaxID=228410 RepID=Q820M9_NITEU|nr:MULTISPECIES: DNA translocase FtsK [Nitrosomonas]CAD84962.1 FtsK/SpoIIIE family:AAA ATPase superfamily [Nitrosomonas europaea ATCC 19718]SDW81580.1 DNA translocase FtsK [Nitrosomonas europaea]SET35825.1 DNA translocase FtsK [Nitrosomonas europaea]SJZ89783.1 DNA translocase FtsK [Nitrosomonas europaea]HBF24520.1 DNA translocase FtsK [Nitrosomonas sp.]